MKINVGVDLGRDSLLLGDEVVLEVGLTEALLKLDESELRCKLAVSPESLDEVIDVASGIGVHEVIPGLISVDALGKVFGVDVELSAALGSSVTGGAALLANGLGTGRRAMAFLTTGAAGA